MKLRLAVLFVLLSFALAACSFAADITPPPGSSSVSHNAAQAALDATQTPDPALVPTGTSVPAAATPETSPAVTGSTTPSVEASPTALASVVVVDGSLTLPSGSTITDGTKAILLVYNNATQQVEQTLDTPILPNGSYEFTDVPATTSTIFLVTVEYGGVTYNSSPIAFDGSLFVLNLPVTVYESSSDLNQLTISQTHLQFDFSTTGTVQVVALYVVANPGPNTVIVTSDGSTVPFIQIPAGGENVSFQLAQSSSPLLRATNGFALAPGSDKQYGIIASFSIPYTGRLVYSQPYNLPVTAATIIVPDGVKIKSDQLTDGGTQASSGTTFHLWQGNSLASGSTLTMTISGMPGDKPGFVLDQRTMIMIGVGAVGLILIALGVFLFLRERRLRKIEDEIEEAGGEEGEPVSTENVRETLLDAIIALEDKFKAGDITKEAYEKRRDELKAQLAGMV